MAFVKSINLSVSERFYSFVFFFLRLKQYLFSRAVHIHKGKDMSKGREGNYLDDSSQNESCQKTKEKKECAVGLSCPDCLSTSIKFTE